jgi:hypothetical protein
VRGILDLRFAISDWLTRYRSRVFQSQIANPKSQINAADYREWIGIIKRLMSIDSLPTTFFTDKFNYLLALDAPAAYSAMVPRGEGSSEARDILESLQPGDVLREKVVDAEMGRAVVGALWLWHDFLDESHTISQAMENPTGSYWHAIMHRREGDFGNSKYWYRQVGKHPAMNTISARADAVLRDLPADKSLFKLVANGWDSFVLVDIAQAVHENPGDPRAATMVSLQKLEWRALLDWTALRATGKGS